MHYYSVASLAWHTNPFTVYSCPLPQTQCLPKTHTHWAPVIWRCLPWVCQALLQFFPLYTHFPLFVMTFLPLAFYLGNTNTSIRNQPKCNFAKLPQHLGASLLMHTEGACSHCSPKKLWNTWKIVCPCTHLSCLLHVSKLGYKDCTILTFWYPMPNCLTQSKYLQEHTEWIHGHRKTQE